MSNGYICDPVEGCPANTPNIYCRAPKCDFGIAQAKRKQAFEAELASVETPQPTTTPAAALVEKGRALDAIREHNASTREWMAARSADEFTSHRSPAAVLNIGQYPGLLLAALDHVDTLLHHTAATERKLAALVAEIEGLPRQSISVEYGMSSMEAYEHGRYLDRAAVLNLLQPTRSTETNDAG